MTLYELRVRMGMLVLVASVALVIITIASVGEARSLMLTAGLVGGLALLVWVIATVADATVNSLKKEN